MLKKLFAPIMLRFWQTQELLESLDVLNRSQFNPSFQRGLIREREQDKLLIARELIRRKVIFW